MYLSEVENSKYGSRNTSTAGSTTGMNKGMPLYLNSNHAFGVTDEGREITWFCKFIKPVNLYHEKEKPTNHRTGSIR